MRGAVNWRMVALLVAAGSLLGGVADASGSGRAAVAAKHKHHKKGGHKKKKSGTTHGAIKGALYQAKPYANDYFKLQVSKDGKSAHFVGTYTYTDPGCPNQPFGNVFLTSANAPVVSIASNGDFSGTKHNRGVSDTISGVFEGAKAPTVFKETESCPGDKPLVVRLTLKTSK